MEEYMLPCVVKYTTGMECIGCGLQRAILAIFQGEFQKAWAIHPASFTTVVLLVYAFLHVFKNFKHGAKVILILTIVNLLISIVQFYLKHYH